MTTTAISQTWLAYSARFTTRTWKEVSAPRNSSMHGIYSVSTRRTGLPHMYGTVLYTTPFQDFVRQPTSSGLNVETSTICLVLHFSCFLICSHAFKQWCESTLSNALHDDTAEVVVKSNACSFFMSDSSPIEVSLAQNSYWKIRRLNTPTHALNSLVEVVSYTSGSMCFNFLRSFGSGKW